MVSQKVGITVRGIFRQKGGVTFHPNFRVTFFDGFAVKLPRLLPYRITRPITTHVEIISCHPVSIQKSTDSHWLCSRKIRS